MRLGWYSRLGWARARRPLTGAFAAVGYGVMFAVVIVAVLAIRAVPTAHAPKRALWQSHYSAADQVDARFAPARENRAR